MILFDYHISTDYPVLPIKGKAVINTINPHSYCVSRNDPDFENALKDSDVLLPDGIGIVWAARVLKGRKIKKIAGYDIFIYLMNHLNATRGTCFFLGASDTTLAMIKQRVAIDFPEVTVSVYSPPYKSAFNEIENEMMCREVNSFRPHVLFVGMTAPKQEKWVHLHMSQLNAQIICSIGAAFDFYAGTVKRPGPFWIKTGLEWLPRFLKDPKRLARRNLVSTPKFLFEVLYFKLFGKGIL